MLKDSEFWSRSTNDVLGELGTSTDGISVTEARERLRQYGANTLKTKSKDGPAVLFFSQFKSPIILILLVATAISLYTGDAIDAIIIFTIVLISGSLGFWQEYSAGEATAKLLALVQIKTNVIRGAEKIEVSSEEIVPGDIIVLNAGDLVPGDCLIYKSGSLFVNESTLTGESYPVEKQAGILPGDTALNKRNNCLWMGTNIISGECHAIVILTGKSTQFGGISERIKLRPPETEFERGIRRFGYFLMIITLILVFSIFIFNVILKKPVLDSFLFSLALAVGMTPQLLPVIISVNLAKGSKLMSQMKVIVKRLSAIENLGSMNVLCSDKTGTLTDGVVTLKDTSDILGAHSDKVLRYAYLNAFFESGFVNPIDKALREFNPVDAAEYTKLDEVPYDFIRKRLSLLIATNKGDGATKNIIITKGAFDSVIDICTQAEMPDGSVVDITGIKESLRSKYIEYCNSGYRTLGICYKEHNGSASFDRTDETGMVFLGFITLFDPPKKDVEAIINNLKNLGISLKIITGDSRYVAESMIKHIGIPNVNIMTGGDLRITSDMALINIVNRISVFAEVEPNQKERIILALKKAGNVVGYMGDGINDVSALHDADVGISVDSAVDVAKEAADIVLLEKDLNVLYEGVIIGRKTFANTLKYVYMATSANFGNMFSMAGASIFLPILPLLPKQVLLTNLMTDFPEMNIATDNVDDEIIDRPHRWDIRFIRKFMIVFGLISSVFDYVTFGVLMFLVKVSEAQFRTGWFTESVISAALIVLVIRSRRPMTRSKPAKPLTIATIVVVIATLLLPYTPAAGPLGLEPLSMEIYAYIGMIVAAYIITAEVAKKYFYKNVTY